MFRRLTQYAIFNARLECLFIAINRSDVLKGFFNKRALVSRRKCKYVEPYCRPIAGGPTKGVGWLDLS
jgi:hypothetical protein